MAENKRNCCFVKTCEFIGQNLTAKISKGEQKVKRFRHRKKLQIPISSTAPCTPKPSRRRTAPALSSIQLFRLRPLDAWELYCQFPSLKELSTVSWQSIWISSASVVLVLLAADRASPGRPSAKRVEELAAFLPGHQCNFRR